jgi:hypothetical protein
LAQEAVMTDLEEARHLLEAAIRRLYALHDAVRAINVASQLVTEQIGLIENGVLAALDDLSENGQ